MELSINWLAVITATIVSMIIAGIWYSKAFGSAWIKLTGVTKQDSKKAGKTPMVTLFVTNLVTAIALTVCIAVAQSFFGSDSLWVALAVGLVVSFAFSVTTLLQHNAFELKPPKLTLINASYQLVLYVGMALSIWLVTTR